MARRKREGAPEAPQDKAGATIDEIRDLAVAVESEEALDWLDAHETDLRDDPGLVDLAIRLADALQHRPREVREVLASIAQRWTGKAASEG